MKALERFPPLQVALSCARVGLPGDLPTTEVLCPGGEEQFFRRGRVEPVNPCGQPLSVGQFLWARLTLHHDAVWVCRVFRIEAPDRFFKGRKFRSWFCGTLSHDCFISKVAYRYKCVPPFCSRQV